MTPVRLACLLVCLVLLSGCGSTLVATVEPVCAEDPATKEKAISDVCVSREDRLTERTASAIEANNLAIRRLCKRAPDCPKPTGKPAPKPTPEAGPKTS